MSGYGHLIAKAFECDDLRKKVKLLEAERDRYREALEDISDGDESLGGKFASNKQLRSIAARALKGDGE